LQIVVCLFNTVCVCLSPHNVRTHPPTPRRPSCQSARSITFSDRGGNGSKVSPVGASVCVGLFVARGTCKLGVVAHPRGSGPQHSVHRLPGSGQVLCTSWRNFAPFSLSTFKNIHGEQAGKRDRGGSAVGARYIVREHDTTQPVLNKDVKRAQRQTAPGVPRKRVRCRGY
jgi:hypothetical protein